MEEELIVQRDGPIEKSFNIPSLKDLFLLRRSGISGYAFVKAAKWKEYGKEGEQARNEGSPQTYLMIYRDPDSDGPYDPSKFKPSARLKVRGKKPTDILYASKYYPDKNGGHASDWDRFIGESMPEWRNSRGFTFQLKPDARIRTINNDDDYLEFHNSYLHPLENEIYWDKVRKDYDAVRFGDWFARTTGRSTTGPIPILDAGQLLVFNPDVVTNAKEWRRNEDLHPEEWYPQWVRDDPEELEWERDYRRRQGKLPNTYTGPEQPTADKDGLDEAWGYRDIPGVADYYTSTKEGMRNNGRDKAV